MARHGKSIALQSDGRADENICQGRAGEKVARSQIAKVIDVWWEENVSVSFQAGSTRGDFNMQLRYLPCPARLNKNHSRPTSGITVAFLSRSIYTSEP